MSRKVWQPVQEYFIRAQPERQPAWIAGTRRLNSFVSYTHLGTDFGFHGPAEHTLQWESDELCAHLGQEPDAWAGVWHSLAGLARDNGKTLDFTAAWPEFIGQRWQPRITGVMLAAKGRGSVKLEIKDAAQEVRWTRSVSVRNASETAVELPVNPESLRQAKLINWTAEPGSEVCIGAVHLAVEKPDVPYDEYILAASYAKLARSYVPASGFVKDRAHVDDGDLASVSATGLFALATAAAAREPVRLVSEGDAVAILRNVHQSVSGLRRAHGLLPHFVRRYDDEYRIHPGTEFSSIDTAIYYQCMLLAARMLDDATVSEDILRAIRSIDFNRLRLPSNAVSHGFQDDGETILPHGWDDWGGETALLMLMQRMAGYEALPPKMKRPGRVWQGTGFIVELQSLLLPDFDSDEPDAVDGVRWRTARLAMLESQRMAVRQTWPDSLATKIGMYGLSAGESEHGDSYFVGGTDLPNQKLIHPHYILMSATLANEPTEIYGLLGRMEAAGLFPPWGMVENVRVDGQSYLPMNGALNAAFEALGAYHLMAKNRGVADGIYEASQACPEIRAGMRVFFPGRVAKLRGTQDAAQGGQ